MPRTFPDGIPAQKIAVAEQQFFTGLVHEVHLVDGSSSMTYQYDNKFLVAVKGVNADLIESRKASYRTRVGGYCSVFQFSSTLTINRYDNIVLLPINSFVEWTAKAMEGNTALYGSIIQTINYFLGIKSTEDRVLMKIFTDGANNVDNQLRGSCAALIAKVQKEDGFTITFVGTKYDVDFVSENLSIDKTNTFVHENDSKSVENAFRFTASASANYRMNLSKGVDVSHGFYSKSL